MVRWVFPESYNLGHTGQQARAPSQPYPRDSRLKDMDIEAKVDFCSAYHLYIYSISHQLKRLML